MTVGELRGELAGEDAETEVMVWREEETDGIYVPASLRSIRIHKNADGDYVEFLEDGPGGDWKRVVAF